MRLPFTKAALSDPELAFPALDADDKTTPSVFLPAETEPPISSSLSPNARQSALQLVGNIREILVGDEIRTIDTRFAHLHSAIETSVTSYVEEIASNVDSIQNAVHSELGDLRDSIAENAASAESRCADTAIKVDLGIERIEAFEKGHRQFAESAIHETTKIADDLRSASVRISTLEDSVSDSLTRFENEDLRITGALEESLSRVTALEARLSEKIDFIDRQQASTAEQMQRGFARVAALEEELRSVSENLQRQDTVLNENIHVAVRHITTHEESVADRLEKIGDRIASNESAAEGDAERIAFLEEKAEALRIGFNEKMSELCDYVSTRIDQAARQNISPAPPARALAPAPASTPAPAFTSAAPAPAEIWAAAAAAETAPAVAAAPQAAAQPASFPSFPSFPTFPSYDAPQQNTQRGFGS